MDLAIMHWLATFSSDALDAVFRVVTALGSETVQIVLLAAIYWCVDRDFGERAGFIVLCGVGANNILKDIFRITRPIGVSGVHTNAAAARELLVSNSPTGYEYSFSFPSGHSQTTASLMTTLALRVKKRWMTALAAVTTLLVMLSRLVLGVHWPSDVLCGCLLGVGLSLLLWRLLSDARINKYYLYALGAIILLVAGFIFARTDDTLKSLGSLCGFAAGVAFENRFVKFSTDRVVWWKCALRLVFGVALLFAVRLGLKAVFPTTLFFAFLRYMLIIFVGMGVWPLIFKKLRI